MTDLISRQAAFDAIADLPYGIRGMVKGILSSLPSAHSSLTEADYRELRDRFGGYVEFVVRDMANGEGKRWEKCD